MDLRERKRTDNHISQKKHAVTSILLWEAAGRRVDGGVVDGDSRSRRRWPQGSGRHERGGSGRRELGGWRRLFGEAGARRPEIIDGRRSYGGARRRDGMGPVSAPHLDLVRFSLNIR